MTVERTTVGNEGASFGNITNKLHLGSLELVSRFHPSDLVVLQRVDKSVSLVHLLASLGSGISELLLLSNFTIVTSSELGLHGVDLVELCFGFSKLRLGLLEGDRFDFEHVELGLHNLGLLMIVGHGGGPSTETPKGTGCNFSDLRIEEKCAFRGRELKVGFKKLNGLLIDLIFLVG